MKFNSRYFFDTETTNDNEAGYAFPVVYTFYDRQNEDVTILRTGAESIDYIIKCVRSSKKDEVPVVCSYNLYFDLFTLLEDLSALFDIRTNAQNTNRLYTLDLLDRSGNVVLRFWDVSHLEPRGIAKMGETCGFPKLDGWDYSKYRTPETPLTPDELEYIESDVKVISSYLDWLNDNTPYISYEDFGNKVITKTSLVRLHAKRVVGKISNGKKTVLEMMQAECQRETPKSYSAYATRKACMRGGLSFTSAKYASTIQKRVFSLDATSMHHTFINGRYIPCKFQPIEDICDKDIVTREIRRLVSLSDDDLLFSYHSPFKAGFNACVRFTNLRLKSESLFGRDHIGTLSESKLFSCAVSIDIEENKRISEEAIMNAGFVDNALNPVYAFGKLMGADIAEVWITESEAYVLGQVYCFDGFEVLSGEYTTHFILPPDYVTLQSCILYRAKAEAKRALGEKPTEEQKQHYEVIVKGAFNSIYGSQVLDVNKPSFTCSNGEIVIDDATLKGFDTELNRQGCVDYPFGIRISGGSRMHLVVAMNLLYKHFGNRIRFIGGDTDSIKISTDEDVSVDEIQESLEPLRKATEKAIKRCQVRILREYPYYSDPLEGVGCFVVENKVPYLSMCEYWDKCRIYRDEEGYHVTSAGIPQPANAWNLEKVLNAISNQGADEEEVYNLLGYNTFFFSSQSFAITSVIPSIFEKVSVDGAEIHKAIMLKETEVLIGDAGAPNRSDSIAYMNYNFGRVPRVYEICYWSENDAICVGNSYTLLRKVLKD